MWVIWFLIISYTYIYIHLYMCVWRQQNVGSCTMVFLSAAWCCAVSWNSPLLELRVVKYRVPEFWVAHLLGFRHFSSFQSLIFFVSWKVAKWNCKLYLIALILLKQMISCEAEMFTFFNDYKLILFNIHPSATKHWSSHSCCCHLKCTTHPNTVADQPPHRNGTPQKQQTMHQATP